MPHTKAFDELLEATNPDSAIAKFIDKKGEGIHHVAFDVEDIYLQYVGKNIKANKTLLEVFELHNSRMKKLIGVEYSKSTYSKFTEAKNHVSNFIRCQYKKGDVLLESINQNFCTSFLAIC